jgi:threonine aldolase
MGRALADATRDLPGVQLVREPEVNSVFARLAPDSIARAQAESFFWMWDEAVDEVRWMTSWDTTAADIEVFVAVLRHALAG